MSNFYKIKQLLEETNPPEDYGDEPSPEENIASIKNYDATLELKLSREMILSNREINALKSIIKQHPDDWENREFEKLSLKPGLGPNFLIKLKVLGLYLPIDDE